MGAFIKVTVLIAILVSLGFTYMSAKEDEVSDKPVRQVITKENEHELTGDNISRDTYKLVREKLITPYTDKTTKEPKRKMFSRCPSGNQPRIKQMAKSKTEYSYGMVRYYEGCDSRKVVCNFRTRLSDNTVDVLQSDSVNYIAANLWIEKAIVSENSDTDREIVEN